MTDNDHGINEPTFELNNFHGKVLLLYSEDLQITKYGFLRFGVPIDFDAQIFTLVLPIKLTLKSIGKKKKDKQWNGKEWTSETLNKFF